MRKHKILFRISRFSLAFLIFIFGFYVPLGYTQDTTADSKSLDSAPLVSLDFKDASFKDVLKALSIQSGINFIAGILQPTQSSHGLRQIAWVITDIKFLFRRPRARVCRATSNVCRNIKAPGI